MPIIKRHRELALASVFALALTGAAGAADLAVRAPVYAPPIPVYSWTGFYLGVGGGTGWGTKEYDWNITSTVNSVLAQFNDGTLPVALNSQGSHGINGGFFGGQLGYDYQAGWLVFGVQADAHWADIEGKGNCFALGLINCNAKVESFGSVTGRLGGAIDHLLVYAKGGWAWENGKSDINVLGLGGLGVGPFSANLASNVDDNRTGWTWGAGAEYAFSPSWTAFVEYNYYDFGSETQNYAFSVSAPGGTLVIPIPTELDEKFHTVKAGINYKFNWGAPVVARY
jgi:outer membrane immunogenic protein